MTSLLLHFHRPCTQDLVDTTCDSSSMPMQENENTSFKNTFFNCISAIFFRKTLSSKPSVIITSISIISDVSWNKKDHQWLQFPSKGLEDAGKMVERYIEKPTDPNMIPHMTRSFPGSAAIFQTIWCVLTTQASGLEMN